MGIKETITNENVCANCIPAWVPASYQVWVCQSEVNLQSFADSKVIRYPSVSLVRLSVHHGEMMDAEFKWKISDIQLGSAEITLTAFVPKYYFHLCKILKIAKHNIQSARFTVPSFSRSQIIGWTCIRTTLGPSLLHFLPKCNSEIFKTPKHFTNSQWFMQT